MKGFLPSLDRGFASIDLLLRPRSIFETEGERSKKANQCQCTRKCEEVNSP